MLQIIELNENKTKTNAEILDETHYDYHGRYDDGDSIVDQFDRIELKGVIVA